MYTAGWCESIVGRKPEALSPEVEARKANIQIPSLQTGLRVLGLPFGSMYLNKEFLGLKVPLTWGLLGPSRFLIWYMP